MLTRETLYTLLDLDLPQDSPQVTIYAPESGERLNYVCHFIFNHVLKLKSRITTSEQELMTSKGMRVNYSDKEIAGSFRIIPRALLSEKGITIKKPEAVKRGEMIYFYTYEENSLFSYDIFSAVFYFISRYEEWQSYSPDMHQRFEAGEALLYKNQFHLKPVVDIWIEELAEALQKFYPEIKFPERSFRVLSTIDVDNLYAYRAKGLIRSLGASAKDLLKLDLTNLKNRIAVLTGRKQDPFDIYKIISELCHEADIPLIYFFLMRNGTAHDRTVDPASPAFDEVFKTVQDQHAFLGLHPSYNSSVESSLLANEKKLIEKKSGTKVVISRQHYLRFNIRSTPKLLMDLGFEADFSMGFASAAGFRAGTSHPFYYYDFESEKGQPLLFVPFCVMDGVYMVYEKVSPEPAYEEMLKLAKEIKKVKGTFISVFHERTFSDHLYKGFGSLYKNLHRTLKEL